MIVQSLASRNPFRQWLLISLVLLPAVVTIATQTISIHIPEDATRYYQMLAEWLQSLPSPWVKVILSGCYLLLIVALLRLSRVPGFYQRASRVTPILIGVISLFLIPENLGVHPTLIALLFLIPAVRNLLMSGDAHPTPSRLFNAGFYIALASLFSFPVVLFFPSFFVVLFVFRLYRWNYSGMVAVGMLIPWVYTLLWGWLSGFYPLQELFGLTGIWLSGLVYFFRFMAVQFSVVQYLATLLMLVFTISAFIAVYSKLDQRVLGIRYLYRSLLWLTIPGIPYAIFSGGLLIQGFLVMLFFITVVGTTYLRELNKPLRVNIVLWGILLLMYLGYIF